MSTGQSGVEGFSPKLAEQPGNPEALKYGRMWDHEVYRHVSPGEQLAQVFLQQARPPKGASVIDFGCGTGRGGYALAVFGGLNVTLVDFVKNSLDGDVKDACQSQPHVLRFVKKDLEQPLVMAAQYGYCCDVMEHIPEDKVDAVLDNVLGAAEHVFFSISTVPDNLGQVIGEQLHMTVQPFDWWLEKFTKRECVVHWSKELDGNALFYVSGWTSGHAVVEGGSLNEELEQIKQNAKTNINNGWEQIVPYESNEMEVMILGGGWSLPEFEEEIKQKRAEGVKLVTLNGTYNWALQHGLVPSAQIMVDARPFNARFTKPCVDEQGVIHGDITGIDQTVLDKLGDIRYLIASQCHPSVLEHLRKDRVWLWHTMVNEIEDSLKARWEKYWPIPSATTVLNTGMILLRTLGYHKFHLYGCDSCLAPDKATHHAYSQPENDNGPLVPVTVKVNAQSEERVFWCNPWMVAQAQQFIDVTKLIGSHVDLEIHGDGLLKYIVEVGAKVADDTTFLS